MVTTGVVGVHASVYDGRGGKVVAMKFDDGVVDGEKETRVAGILGRRCAVGLFRGSKLSGGGIV